MAQTGGPALGVVFAKQEFDTVTSNTMNVSTLNVTTQAVASQTIATLAVTSSAQLGNASTDTLGFYGATVTTQPATVTSVTTATITSVTTTAATSTTPYGYLTSTQADALVSAVNALITRNASVVDSLNSIGTKLTALGLTA